MQRNCIFNKTRQYLDSLRPDSNLTSLETISTRRRAVQKMACRSKYESTDDARDTFLLLPAAVGTHDGVVELHTTFEQLLRGGAISFPEYAHKSTLWGTTQHLSAFVVNFSDFLVSTVAETDTVYVKMVRALSLKNLWRSCRSTRARFHLHRTSRGLNIG